METYLQDLGMEISLEASKIKEFGRNKANEVQVRLAIVFLRMRLPSRQAFRNRMAGGLLRLGMVST